ncbi:MAG: TetR/AcrR family transcriptional regulator [Streptosporangiaceae bacterium]|nr:TetR/AcrR family transcriptional regulator [Streptosporangiaceae bacterium]
MFVEDLEDTRAIRRNATRARILDAAWDLARRDGLAAITLREIARRVGMRAPSLYTYFPSKNAMYDAMYADAARELAETLAARPQAGDPRETLRSRMRLFTAFCVADPVRYQMIFERPVPGFAPAPESFQLTAAALAGTRADMQAVGVAGEPALDMFRALITGLVSLQVANDPGGDRWTRLQDDAVDMFFAHYAGGTRSAVQPAGETQGAAHDHQQPPASR